MKNLGFLGLLFSSGRFYSSLEFLDLGSERGVLDSDDDDDDDDADHDDDDDDDVCDGGGSDGDGDVLVHIE